MGSVKGVTMLGRWSVVTMGQTVVRHYKPLVRRMLQAIVQPVQELPSGMHDGAI
jgi:hypothetical protein